jgi:hypothetical protein
MNGSKESSHVEVTYEDSAHHFDIMGIVRFVNSFYEAEQLTEFLYGSIEAVA